MGQIGLKHRSLSACVRNVGLGLVVFLVSCGAFHALVPPPAVPVITPKLDYFSRHADSFNAVFIGSSRICHGISPAVFDDAMRAQGYDIKSFNFGVDGMFPPESFAVLDKLLQHHSPKLKWVFIELTPIHPVAQYHHEGTLRASWWHDYPQTQRMLREAAVHFHSNDFLPVAGLMFDHLRLFALNLSNVGNGVDLFTAEDNPEPSWVPDAGFFPLSGTRFKSEKQSQEYRADVQRMIHPTKKPAPSDPVSIEGFETVTLELERHGMTPIFVIAPTAYGADNFFAKEPGSHPTFAFADPVKFPQLYQKDRRYDSDHLNRTGAEEFTRMLASQFGAYLARNH